MDLVVLVLAYPLEPLSQVQQLVEFDELTRTASSLSANAPSGKAGTWLAISACFAFSASVACCSLCIRLLDKLRACLAGQEHKTLCVL